MFQISSIFSNDFQCLDANNCGIHIKCIVIDRHIYHGAKEAEHCVPSKYVGHVNMIVTIIRNFYFFISILGYNNGYALFNNNK